MCALRFAVSYVTFPHVTGYANPNVSKGCSLCCFWILCPLFLCVRLSCPIRFSGYWLLRTLNIDQRTKCLTSMPWKHASKPLADCSTIRNACPEKRTLSAPWHGRTESVALFRLPLRLMCRSRVCCQLRPFKAWNLRLSFVRYMCQPWDYFCSSWAEVMDSSSVAGLFSLSPFSGAVMSCRLQA